MARCDYCKSYILFGGQKQSGRTFCNDECLQEGRLMMAADRLPQHAVDDSVDETHQGKCSLCHGPGPIDVHTSHTVWSIIAMTSWKSTPYVCCRSCGRQKQLTGFVTSALFGWWGFPWGFIYTPIQLCRNLSGIIGGPDPEVPSEQLETLTRLDLAIRIEAREPLPGRHKPSRKSQNVEPADDRIPVECEDCGKRFKAKATMAGKSGKCPGCGSSITVPLADEWLDDEDACGTDDEWGGDSYEDDDNNPYADNWDEPSSPRRPSKSRRKSKPKKKKWTPLRIGIFVGLGIAAVNILVVVIGLIISLFNNKEPRPQFGQNDPVIPNSGQPNFDARPFPNQATGNQPASNTTESVTAIQPTNNAATAQTTPQTGTPNTVGNSQPQTSSPATPAETKPVPPLKNTTPGGQLWIVLSNFRSAPTQGFGSINRRWQIDYQVAAGTPSPNEKYVLHVSKSFGGGSFTQFSDTAVELNTSGSIDFGVSPALGAGTDFVATIAIAQGGRKWNHISGELAPGGSATTTERPPTIRELAGAAAQGKVVAITNPVFDNGSGPFATLTVEFHLQQQIDLARYYMLVAETSNGKRFDFDVKFTLQRAKVGDEGKFSARLTGPVGELKPPFTLHVEKRTSRFPIRTRPETPEVVSNKVNVAG